MNHRCVAHALTSILLLLATLTGAAFAQQRYGVPEGRFSVPLPTDWTVAETPGVLTFEHKVIEAIIDAGDHTLAGTLTLPAGDGRVPAIVLVSGSGAQDRDGANPSMPGYATLRWLWITQRFLP